VDDTNLVLDSLSKLITTTKLKVDFIFYFLHLFVSCVCYVLTLTFSILLLQTVCNLGVWCLSVQQLGVSFLVTHFDSLLRAIVHALDNPMGSLSTTFEATQVLVFFNKVFVLTCSYMQFLKRKDS